MKNRFYFLVILSLIISTQLTAQLLTRTAEIMEKSKIEVGGFGNLIAGVDFDKDGRPEIYAVNSNAVDRAEELIPRIYKFEYNPLTKTWDEVWMATAPLSTQNTWPALAWGDTDKDGKPEIYWGVVNATVPISGGIYQDIPRILVYEHPGGKTDDMGVSDGIGGFLPNATTNIMPGTGLNIRPFRFLIADVDKDNKDEIVFCDRAPSTTNTTAVHLGVMSVDKIPDLGGGGEKWTLEYNASLDATVKSTNSAKWDVAFLNNVIYMFEASGRVVGVKYENNAWKVVKAQTSFNSIGSFKGTKVVDINKDGKNEILLADWFNNAKGAGAKVWLLQQVADTLQATALNDFEPLGAVRLNGADAGDIDGDGRLDFVFGSRHDANNSRRKPVFRLEYQSGDITKEASYSATVIDSAHGTKTGDIDAIAVANVDGDADHEVIYTQGYPRGDGTNDRMPIVIIDRQFTPVSVENISYEIPTDFYLEQNYPNPFNPTTNIRFGLNKTAIVQLKVYNLLGEEVATLLNNELLNAGNYNYMFKANNLTSGIYIYTLKAGNYTLSRKMQLIK
ncbi:MAG: T9SS type A sorting domain-containing protein [Melioribacteraceae bacterium]|nr:T9SS type A sorting domain-containing protein [Melioribacteraceae bacterium]